jgi:VacB/RNase II family 3'-5' exoribonuclease
MLDAKSLDLLQSLKTEIKASKTVLKGKIKGTGRNFGFAVAEDGSEHFLAPDQMAKVFPGDEVTFTVTEQDDGKTRGELESLEKSNFKEFKGVFYKRGKAQGVEPFSDAFSGWLFVPPKHVLEATHNDIVVAKVTRHPWQTSKAQAEVIQTIGSADNNRTWYSMSLSEHNIPEGFTDSELEEAGSLTKLKFATDSARIDDTDTPFVTIDSASTQDMDDALYAEATESGWLLKVAIADASEFIKPGSQLDAAAKQRLTTTYLPGLILPMLPESLSNGAISLVPNEVRPALVFEMIVLPSGEIQSFKPTLSLVKNHAKLNYEEVAEWLDSGSTPEAYANSIRDLADVTAALGNWRKTHCNEMQNRTDYRIRVDESFNVTGIDKETRSIARDLVEESMVATNAQVAKWLSDGPALFMTHQGFKADRETELKGLLRDYAKEVAELDGHNLSEFIQILKSAQQVESFPLLQVLQKRFERGTWSNTAKPHFGLGLPEYTNATSPIRKYTDLLIHRLIKSKLSHTEFEITETDVTDINERNSSSRFVAHAVDNRLRFKWLMTQPSGPWDGTIVHINANGLVVQLLENGATGFIDLRKKKVDFAYDPLRMMLKLDEGNYQLGQPLTVNIAKVDEESLSLSIVDKPA